MHTDIIIIGSITYTMKAKNALHSAGIRATIRKAEPGRRGCSYALEIPSGQMLATAAILRNIGISYELVNK